MADCPNAKRGVGQDLVASFAVGCGDLDFETATYKLFGSMNTKSLDFTLNTGNARSDASGNYDDVYSTYLGATFAISGFTDLIDSALSNQNELIQYYFDEVAAGRQPTMWLKFSGPDYPRIYYVYVLMTQSTEGANTDEKLSSSFNFTLTATKEAGVAPVQIRTPT